MQVKDILDQKGGDVIALLPETIITGAALLLSQGDIGVAIVADPENAVLGIISERDISRGLGEHGGKILEMRVDELMISEVITCSKECSVDDALVKMQSNKIRHLLVVDGDHKLVGLISMRDILDFRFNEFDAEHKPSPLEDSVKLAG